MSENGSTCGKEVVDCKSFESCKGVVQVFSSPRFERLEALLAALEERTKLQFFLNAEAYQLRNAQTDKRLDTMNEFRGALADREASYFTRTEHELYAKLVEADLRVLRESKAEMRGKASQFNLNVTFIIAIVGDCIALAALLFTIFRH
jgi:hypothetical protein